MNDVVTKALQYLFGSGTWRMDTTPEGVKRSSEIQPGVFGKIRNFFTGYKAPEGGKINVQPTATPTPTAMPTATPTPQTRIAQYEQPRTIEGFTGRLPEENIVGTILDASARTGINPAIVAAMLYQESAGTWDPQVVGPLGEWGLAQIYPKMHPAVTQEQAFDPNYAINWLVDYLSASQNKFNDINRSIASYNVGRGGANVQGPEPYGGGPLGQRYLDNIARNLTPELISELGLKVTPGLLGQY